MVKRSRIRARWALAALSAAVLLGVGACQSVSWRQVASEQDGCAFEMPASPTKLRKVKPRAPAVELRAWRVYLRTATGDYPPRPLGVGFMMQCEVFPKEYDPLAGGYERLEDFLVARLEAYAQQSDGTVTEWHPVGRGAYPGIQGNISFGQVYERARVYYGNGRTYTLHVLVGGAVEFPAQGEQFLNSLRISPLKGYPLPRVGETGAQTAVPE